MFSKWKKGVCLILALVLLLPAFPATAFADGELEPREAEVVNRELSPMEQLQTGANEEKFDVKNIKEDRVESLNESVEPLNNSEQEEIPTPEDLGYKFDANSGTITNYTGKVKDLVIPSVFSVEGKNVEVKAIGKQAFDWNISIEKITIPSSIKVISDNAFQYCSNVKEVEFESPNENLTLKQGAFSMCLGLEKVNLPEGLKILPSELFAYSFQREGDKIIKIPSTIVEIQESVINQGGITLDFELTEEEYDAQVTVHKNAFLEKNPTLKFKPSEPVEKDVITDPTLKKAINLYMKAEVTGQENRTEDQAITAKEIGSLDRIVLDYLDGGLEETKKIESIDGLQYATGATVINLQGTNVTDLSPLKDLTKVYWLRLGGSHYTKKEYEEKYDIEIVNVELVPDSTKWRSPLEDISPISTMTGLKNLRIEDSNVKDISAIGELIKNKKAEGLDHTKLEKVYLRRNKIKSAEPLRDGEITTHLHIMANCIRDKSPLASVKPGKIATCDYQTVNWTPETVIFDNPLKTIGGKNENINRTKYVDKVVDHPEKIQVFKKPAKGNTIEVEYGLGSKLIIDISKIAEQLDVLNQYDVTIKTTPEEATVKVKDAETNKEIKPIEEGVYKLEVGDYKVTVSAEGFEQKTERITVSDDKEKQSFNINLKDSVEKTHEVYFNVQRKQGDTLIGVRNRAQIEISKIENGKKTPVKNINTVPYIWNLPDGDYEYTASYRGYKDETGKFTVDGKDQEIYVSLQYDTEHNQPYPTIEEFKILDRRDASEIGEVTINGHIISVVIEDKADRELCYNGKAMIWAKTKNAQKYMAVTEAGPSSPNIWQTYGTASKLASKSSDKLTYFKKDALTYIELTGKNGKRGHYAVVIKEKPNQCAVISMAPSYTDNKLGAIKIPYGELFDRESFYEVFRFYQLVDKGQLAKEPMQYIKDQYGKNAYLDHKHSVFEGWYTDYDWEHEFKFETTPITRDVEVYAKFSHVPSINDFSKPFNVWFYGPGAFKNEGKGNFNVENTGILNDISYAITSEGDNNDDIDYINLSDDNGAHRDLKVKYGDELHFKFDIDDEWALGYVYATHDKEMLPITQHEDGSFSYKPGPAQNDTRFPKERVVFNLIPKDDASKEPFDINKQHFINVLSKGTGFNFGFVSKIINDDEVGHALAQEGNTVRFRVAGRRIDKVKVINENGEEIPIIEIKENIGKDQNKRSINEYSFKMPASNVDIICEGEYYAPVKDGYVRFKVQDQDGNEIPEEKVKKLTIYSPPYEFEITDITKDSLIKIRETGQYYSYKLELEDYGDFYDEFVCYGDPEKPIVLTVDTDREVAKTRQDVENLIEVAEGLLDRTDLYPEEDLKDLQNAINDAKHKMNLQNFDNAFFSLAAVLGNLEALPTEPGDDDKPDNPKPGDDKPDNPKPGDDDKPVDPKPGDDDKPVVDNRKALKSLYDNVKDLDKADFTEESWANFKAALDKAKEVLDNGNASDKDLKKAKDALNKAFNDLVYAETGDKISDEAEAINKAHEELVNKIRFEQMEDVDGHWAEDVIEYVMTKGYFIGTSETTFAPNDPASRAEFITVLGRIADIDLEGYKDNEFTDVPTGVYYEPFINWAVEHDIIKGVGDNKFEPNRSMTREEMAVMLDKFLEVVGKEYEKGDGKVYSDSDEISSWAVPSIQRLTEEGILQGRDYNEFAPKASFTRAEVAQVIYNLEHK